MEWSPCRVLEIAHLSTCAGFAATTGRRCGNRLAACKKEAAEGLLDEMSFYPISDEGVLVKLMESLAPYLLCSQWHEDQTSTLIGRWKMRILNSRKAEVLQEIQESSRELEDITAKLGRASLAGVQPLPSHGRTATRNPVTLPRDGGSAPGNATPRFKVSGISFGCIDDFQVPNPRSSPPQHQSRREDSKAPTSSTDKASSWQISASPERTVGHKSSSQSQEYVCDDKKDCPICLEANKDDRHSVARCPGCLEVFHESCVDLWIKECVINGGNSTCPFW